MGLCARGRDSSWADGSTSHRRFQPAWILDDSGCYLGLRTGGPASGLLPEAQKHSAQEVLTEAVREF